MLIKKIICIGGVIINNKKKSIQFASAVEKRNLQEHKKTSMRNKKSARAYIMFMITAFTIYFAVYLYQYYKSPVLDISTIEKGVMDLTNLENGIIVREETVYKNNEAGSVIYKLQNNEKVGINDEIAIIANDDYFDTNAYMVKNNLNVSDYEENYLLYEHEINNINHKIKKYVDDADINSFRELYLMKSHIENEISTRNEYLISNNDTNQNITIKEALIAETSGIVSYNIDGYEEIISYDKLDDITENYTNMTQTKRAFQSKKTVTNDEEIYKIVNSNTWYIVSYIENERLENIDAGGYHKLYINSGTEYIDIWFYVESIEKREESSKVVFKSTKRISDFLEYRNIEFKLYNEVYEGLKIPLSSVTEKEFLEISLDYIYQKETFYVKKEISEGSIIEVPINVWLTDIEKNIAYLKEEENQSINQGDIIVSDDSEVVYQIQKPVVLNGVLKVNNGFAEFKPIILEGKIPPEREVTILNTKQNKYIKEYDKIVTLSDTISEGERISR